jgi:DNA modification methylase
MSHRVEHLAEGVTLHCGDCREILPTLGKVDLVFTSPPYGQQRHYCLGEFEWQQVVCGALTKISSRDAQVFVNLGLIHRNGQVLSYWDDMISAMRSEGWRLFGWYVWDQGPGLPGDWQGRLAPAHEWIFHFNITVRKPNKTVPCFFAGKSRGKKSGLRSADGSIAAWSAEDLTTQDARIPDTVIRTVRHKHVGGIEAGHPAVFPVGLPTEIIAAFSDELETILDPFMGSGTTGVAAVKLGRRFIGIEIEERYFSIACKRIDDALRRPDLFIDQPKPIDKQEALL